MKRGLIITGGIINLLLAVFHLCFWKLFDWPNSLMCLTLDNRSVMQVLNIHLTFIIVFFAFVSIFQNRSLISTALGRSIAIAIALFYLLRAVNQLVFWPMGAESVVIIGGAVIISIIYIIPILMKNEIAD